LRARIDSEVAKPAVILVTSAEHGDGANLTAYTIAGAFADTGVRTVLFDATSNVQNDRQSDGNSAGSGSVGKRVLANVCRPEVLQSRELLVDFVTSLRLSYEITIIEAPPVLESGTANALIAMADAALIAIRLGRVAGDGDVLISRILEDREDCFLGIITTDAGAIAEFEATSPKLPIPTRIEVQTTPVMNQSLVRQISAGTLGLIFLLLVATVIAESSQMRGTRIGQSFLATTEIASNIEPSTLAGR
jgi:hypothetical protein